MLNELLKVERSVKAAGFELTERHGSIKDAGGKPTLVVELDDKGNVNSVHPLPKQTRPWTLRDGQHNSFPFVQINAPLWDVDGGDAWRDGLLKKKRQVWRDELLLLEDNARCQIADWPSSALVKRVRERGAQFASLKGTEAAVVRTTIGRFLRAIRVKVEGDRSSLITKVIQALMSELRLNPNEDLVGVAIALLVGKKQKGKWMCNAAILFDTASSRLSVADQRLIPYINGALTTESQDKHVLKAFTCALTGTPGRPHVGNFPQPRLPILGQTYLFSKNINIPASGRYGRFADEAIPVGADTMIQLDAALRELTLPERMNKTWRGIPAESSKKRDLLVAFVESALDAPLAESLSSEDFSDASSPSSDADSIAAFEKRTERLIDLVKAKVEDLNTQVRMILLRGVDRGNRKVVYADTFSVSELYRSAVEWSAGERNIPPVVLPVRINVETKRMAPPHLAPLGLIDFSKQVFLRNGERSPAKKNDQVGLPASEALRFFRSSTDSMNFIEEEPVRRVLHLVLSRRSFLLDKVAHVQHTPQSWSRRDDEVKKYDYREALRTITILGLTLSKLKRSKEVYMKEAAFRLGQLLSAADLVHAGYCADVRSGSVPPSLLGNQVFAMAQSSPARALALLSTRWKPYDGWISRKVREGYEPPARLIAENGRLKKDNEVSTKEDKKELRKVWAIKTAMYQRGKASDICRELCESLPPRCDDTFRAELLLGYIAGIPWEQSVDVDDSNSHQLQHA